MAVILVHGPSGSGKGTQCSLLATQMKSVRISTGDLLRQNTRTFNDIADGTLAKSEDILRLLHEALAKVDPDQSIILDGVARMPEEAKWLSGELQRLGRQVDIVIELVIPADETLRRLLKRNDHRPDDEAASIRKRLDWYTNVVSQTLDYWKTQTRVVKVDGVGTREAVAARIQGVLDAA